MRKRLLLVALGVACSPLALADDGGQSASIQQQLQQLESQVNALSDQQSSAPDWVNKLHIHGFASYGVERSNFTGASYLSSADSAGQIYGGVGNQWDWRGLGRAGLQVAADLDDNTQLVTQFLARGTDNYAVRLQWAYLQHNITPDLTIRAGRLVLPFYMHSQYYDVGYAYAWPSLPDEVYNTVPGDTADGVDLAYNVATGPVAHTLELQWSNTDIVVPNGTSISTYHVQDMISGNISSTWKSLTVRLGYSGGQITMSPDPQPVTINVPNPLPPPPTLPITLPALPPIHSQYGYFANAGFKYDDGRYLLTGEWVQLDVNGWFPRFNSYYATGGVHFGRWLPLITYGAVDTTHPGERTFPGYGTVSSEHQKSLSYGVRYDATSHVSLKAELTHIYGLDGTSGLFNAVPDQSSGQLLRLSVDAMF